MQRPYALRLDRHVDLFMAGERHATIQLGARKIQASYSLSEAGGMAWSPKSEEIALLLDGQEVRVHDSTGSVVSQFSARIPELPAGFPEHYARPSSEFAFTGGLLWGPNRRIVRIAPHVVSFWSVSGKKIAEFIVPEL